MIHQVHDKLLEAMLSQKQYKQDLGTLIPCFIEEPMDSF